MITATLHLPSQLKSADLCSLSFLKLQRQFHSKVTIQRGNHILFDSSGDKKFVEQSQNGSAELLITIDGKDEMKVACKLIDFFNHGSGI